jgi:hypothetical protein
MVKLRPFPSTHQTASSVLLRRQGCSPLTLWVASHQSLKYLVRLSVLEADKQQLNEHSSNTGQNEVVSQRSSPAIAIKVMYKPKERGHTEQDQREEYKVNLSGSAHFSMRQTSSRILLQSVLY